MKENDNFLRKSKLDGFILVLQYYEVIIPHCFLIQGGCRKCANKQTDRRSSSRTIICLLQGNIQFSKNFACQRQTHETQAQPLLFASLFNIWLEDWKKALRPIETTTLRPRETAQSPTQLWGVKRTLGTG